MRFSLLLWTVSTHCRCLSALTPFNTKQTLINLSALIEWDRNNNKKQILLGLLFELTAVDWNNNFRKVFSETVEMKSEADRMSEAKKRKHPACPSPSGDGGGKKTCLCIKKKTTLNHTLIAHRKHIKPLNINDPFDGLSACATAAPEFKTPCGFLWNKTISFRLPFWKERPCSTATSLADKLQLKCCRWVCYI